MGPDGREKVATSRCSRSLPYLMHTLCTGFRKGMSKKLDIILHIQTFLFQMHTMHTMHTFFIKCRCMKVKDSKIIKKNQTKKQLSFLERLTLGTRSFKGVQVCMVCMVCILRKASKKHHIGDSEDNAEALRRWAEICSDTAVTFHAGTLRHKVDHALREHDWCDRLRTIITGSSLWMNGSGYNKYVFQ